MADGFKITGLDSIVTLENDAVFYIVHNDQDWKVSVGQFKALLLQNLPPQPLPEGLVDEEKLSEALAVYYTSEQVDQAISEAIAAIPGLPNDLVRTSDLTEITEDIGGLKTRVQTLEQKNTVTEEQLSEAFENFVPTLPSDVVRTNDLEVYATKSELEAAIEGIAIPEIPNDLVHQAELEAVTDRVTELEGKNPQLGNVFYVNGRVLESGDGSINRPFKTIGDALAVAPKLSVIQLAPGLYTEDVTITTDNITIQGYGAQDSAQVSIAGKMTIGAPGHTRARLKDVTLTNVDNTQPVLVFNGGDLRHYFYNVTVEMIANTLVAPIQFQGELKNWVDFKDCNLGGEVLLDGQPQPGTLVAFRGGNHNKTKITVNNDNYLVRVQDTRRIDSIVHNAGAVHVVNMSNITTGITSNSDTGKIRLAFVDFVRENGTSAAYNKLGSCPDDLAMCVGVNP